MYTQLSDRKKNCLVVPVCLTCLQVAMHDLFSQVLNSSLNLFEGDCVYMDFHSSVDPTDSGMLDSFCLVLLGAPEFDLWWIQHIQTCMLYICLWTKRIWTLETGMNFFFTEDVYQTVQNCANFGCRNDYLQTIFLRIRKFEPQFLNCKIIMINLECRRFLMILFFLSFGYTRHHRNS